jgi:predicted metal-dependent hydrolase
VVGPVRRAVRRVPHRAAGAVRTVAERALPPAFFDGVRRFAAADYFAAHEAFEECLDAVEADARWDLVLALVQVAVGYHKLASGHPGAERMLGLGGEKLAAFPDVAWGVDVARLRRRVDVDRERLSAAALAADPPRIEMAGA